MKAGLYTVVKVRKQKRTLDVHWLPVLPFPAQQLLPAWPLQLPCGYSLQHEARTDVSLPLFGQCSQIKPRVSPVSLHCPHSQNATVQIIIITIIFIQNTHLLGKEHIVTAWYFFVQIQFSEVMMCFLSIFRQGIFDINNII